MTKKEMKRLIEVFDTFLTSLKDYVLLSEEEKDMGKISFILGYEQALKEIKANGKRKK